MRREWIAMAPLLGTLLLGSPSVGLHAQSEQGAVVTASGAVLATNGDFTLNATVGQPAIGQITGTDENIDQGFWHASTHPLAAVENPTTGTGRERMEFSPNPFSESTRLSFHTAGEDRITITLYDLLGRPVRTLFDDRHSEGTLTLTLDAGDLSSGRYTVVLEAGEERLSMSLELVR